MTETDDELPQITLSEFTARFTVKVIDIMKSRGPLSEQDEKDLREYCVQAAESYFEDTWIDVDSPDSPEECAEVDVSYWD